MPRSAFEARGELFVVRRVLSGCTGRRLHLRARAVRPPGAGPPTCATRSSRSVDLRARRRRSTARRTRSSPASSAATTATTANGEHARRTASTTRSRRSSSRSPEGTQAGSFTVQRQLGGPARRPRPLRLPGARQRRHDRRRRTIAQQSASFGDNTEDATYTPRILGSPVETLPDDATWSSSTTGARATPTTTRRRPRRTRRDCPIGADPPADEDDFVGSVALGPVADQQPAAERDARAARTAGRPASAADLHGARHRSGRRDRRTTVRPRRRRVLRDQHAAPAPPPAPRSPAPATYNVGVQVHRRRAATPRTRARPCGSRGPPARPSRAALKPLQLVQAQLARVRRPQGPLAGGPLPAARALARHASALYRGKTRVRRLASGPSAAEPHLPHQGPAAAACAAATYTAAAHRPRARRGKRQRARLTAKRL